MKGDPGLIAISPDNNSLKQKFVFTKRVDKGWITTVKDLESSIHSDDGLPLETSAF